MSCCPICGTPCDARLLAKGMALQPTVARLIATYHATWRPQQGICPRCAQQYAAKVAEARQAHSLHTTHDPHTTFPYYHPWEETVCSQAERLPDYSIFSGEAVTVAFLDSGYYPHPDLLTSRAWDGPMPPWERLDAGDLQRLIESQELRFADYVDLTNGGERVGINQPSLWDGAGDSWHGQMTTTLVAGNGLLSGGRYRGYAPQAMILPVKIGRGGGRIPEADILRGLEWLLRDDNWARYHVRVLNISVGGDFPQPWQENPVAQAAEALFARGVFIAAAAGNSGREALRAPASAPSVLTVGGVDDGNQLWSRDHAPQRMGLYPHNYGVVTSAIAQQGVKNRQSARGDLPRLLSKPELLAVARWLPAPILPVSPIFREVATIGELRCLLLGYDPLRNDDFGWRHTHAMTDEIARYRPPFWMPEVWHGLRQRMNAHKWVHPYYQHVDGTSVSVAQVSAVAAQMVQANPELTPLQIRAILLESALPLPRLPHHLTGHGLLQPRQAVAIALRTAGGVLTGNPQSGTTLSLRDVAALSVPTWQPMADAMTSAGAHVGPLQTVYVGCYAPEAETVALTGDFTSWQLDQCQLQPTRVGWWHGAVTLPPGRYAYRFWIEGRRTVNGEWRPDYENPATVVSGYNDAHSLMNVV
ncbi:MAG TPA: S8 family serine peptidase [Caldilineaceae bacterium]|nr:S8 family serine peptidase [Caldilineaceae bacterium]